MKESEAEKLWNSSYILMLIINALIFVGFTMMTPALQATCAKKLGPSRV